MNRRDRIFSNGVMVAIGMELVGVFAGKPVWAEVGVVAMATMFVMWRVVARSDANAERRARARRRQEVQR